MSYEYMYIYIYIYTYVHIYIERERDREREREIERERYILDHTIRPRSPLRGASERLRAAAAPDDVPLVSGLGAADLFVAFLHVISLCVVCFIVLFLIFVYICLQTGRGGFCCYLLTVSCLIIRL